MASNMDNTSCVWDALVDKSVPTAIAMVVLSTLDLSSARVTN